MKACLLSLVLLALPALAQSPEWQFKPLCNEGKLVGLIIAAPAAGAIAVRFDSDKLCAGSI